MGCGEENESKWEKGKIRIREKMKERHVMPHIYSKFVHIRRKKYQEIRSSEYIHCCDMRKKLASGCLIFNFDWSIKFKQLL